jgi:hypothetical protein
MTKYTVSETGSYQRDLVYEAESEEEAQEMYYDEEPFISEEYYHSPDGLSSSEAE